MIDNILRTCVSPEGRFIFGLHRPCYSVTNLRDEDYLVALGRTAAGDIAMNTANFPASAVDEPGADPIFEIPNPLPFRGTTYIGKGWADRTAGDLERIAIAAKPELSFVRTIVNSVLDGREDEELLNRLFAGLPRPVKLAVAATSTDPADLTRLAELSCDFAFDPISGLPGGLIYADTETGAGKAIIHDEQLFDSVANNPCLPQEYKTVMVLRPGAQGRSEIVGEYKMGSCHVFEYLRRNSYIPWGHYAANMADDAVRYAAGDLTWEDIRGLRHLYYQRTYVRLAADLGLHVPDRRKTLSDKALEALRIEVVRALQSITDAGSLPFTATLWGWNYGFDYAPSGYRLHASHQQIHQQYAMIPETVATDGSEAGESGPLRAFACGDMVHDFIQAFRRQTGKSFFDCYSSAIENNRRMDGRQDRPDSLVVYEDDHVLLFVPKAQTSQWELQLMARGCVGNIVEADTAVRDALNRAMLAAMQTLAAMGAAMITVIEYSKRLHLQHSDQRLLYSFLPRLPESPGAFSEAQLRWINGHYPEDFALKCRNKLNELTRGSAQNDNKRP